MTAEELLCMAPDLDEAEYLRGVRSLSDFEFQRLLDRLEEEAVVDGYVGAALRGGVIQ